MLYYKPKNLKKFLPSVITLGLFMMFLTINIFSRGFSFSGLNAYLIGTGAAVLVFLVANQKIHDIALAIFGVCLAFFGLVLDMVFLTDFGYNNMFAEGYYVLFGIGGLLHDLYMLLLLSLLTFAVLAFVFKWKALSKILLIGFIAVAGTFALSFLFEFIGGIIIAANEEYITFGDVLVNGRVFYPFLPLSMLAFFFFNIDELGFDFSLKTKSEVKEEPKQVEEKKEEPKVDTPAPVEEAPAAEEPKVEEEPVVEATEEPKAE